MASIGGNDVSRQTHTVCKRVKKKKKQAGPGGRHPPTLKVKTRPGATLARENSPTRPPASLSWSLSTEKPVRPCLYLPAICCL